MTHRNVLPTGQQVASSVIFRAEILVGITHGNLVAAGRSDVEHDIVTHRCIITVTRYFEKAGVSQTESVRAGCPDKA